MVSGEDVEAATSDLRRPLNGVDAGAEAGESSAASPGEPSDASHSADGSSRARNPKGDACPPAAVAEEGNCASESGTPSPSEPPALPDAAAETQATLDQGRPPALGDRIVDRTLSATPAGADTLTSAEVHGDLSEADIPIRDPTRYRIESEHGRGGLGRVLVVRDRELGRTIAIKEMLWPRASDEKRFLREAHRAAGAPRHCSRLRSRSVAKRKALLRDEAH